MERTVIIYKGKAWQIDIQLECKEENMKKYKVTYKKTVMICKVDDYSGQVVKD